MRKPRKIRFLLPDVQRRFVVAGLLLGVIVTGGTAGFWYFGGGDYGIVDCLYMTLITISTIGFEEVVDMTGKPAGRLFTILVAFSGIGVLTYVISNVTALLVEGEISERFRRMKMEKMIEKMRDHYIVCGAGNVGSHVARELHSTGRPFVVVDQEKGNIENISREVKELLFVEGLATEDEILLTAGVRNARGLFAVTGDDNQNLVVALTARGLNPGLKIVARCAMLENVDKMKKAGADSVISPDFIGGLRMASEMIRPHVVSFLDTMLREEKNLRVEEVHVPERFFGRAVSELDLKRFPQTLLLAVKRGQRGWVYAPPDGYVMEKGDVLVLMAPLKERGELEEFFRV